MIAAVRRLGQFSEKQEKIWNYLRLFRSVFWLENSCKFSSLQEKALESMTLYIVKYCFCEDQTTPTDCTNVSCTRPYEIRPMNLLQFSEHFCNRCVLPNYWILQKCSKFPHWLIFPRNYFGAEMYLGVSLLTFYNDFSVWQQVNRFILRHSWVHFKRQTSPLSRLWIN